MTEITFTVDGVDGEFAADLDELKSYKTVKQFARSETDPAGMMDAMERIFMGRDEEYIEALGGTSYDMRRPVRRGLRGGKDKKLVGFASDLENRRGEAIADFQQFYGIALPLDGAPEDLDRMALLWQHLPDNSRLAKAQYPQLGGARPTTCSGVSSTSFGASPGAWPTRRTGARSLPSLSRRRRSSQSLSATARTRWKPRKR